MPVPDAIVRVEGTSLRATTNAAGAYEIAGVPAGTHTLLVGLIGYKPSKGVVTVEANGAANADFRLEDARILTVTEIGEVTVSLLRFNAPDRIVQRQALQLAKAYPRV